MKHQVTYKNAQLDWKDGLPLGNGVFGGMTYFNNNALFFLMNHYEVYYRKHQKYSKTYRDKRENQKKVYGDGSRYQKMTALADQYYSDYRKDAAYNYFETLFHFSDTYGHELRGVSHMPTGEIELCLSEKIKEGDYSFRLLTEEARTELKLHWEKDQININTIVTREKDQILFEVNQTRSNLIENIKLKYPRRRYQSSFVSSFEKISENTFCLTVTFSCGTEEVKQAPETFTFVVMLSIKGAKGEVSISEEEMQISLYDQKESITIIANVLTEEQGADLQQIGLQQILDSFHNLETINKEHQLYWNTFFNRARLTLPDKFLENLWYINLYALGCCSGKGGKMYPDASGLNGLWDVKQPNIWGSSWYWDVNVQATYWPVYTAGHLELSEVFIEALLYYTSEMESMANLDYGVDGCAMDYPHMLYNCIQPWCAQWLWWHYEYTGDEVFLREKAYPHFKKLLQFICNIIRWDEQRGTYYFYPEISPEQGPLTRNATITLATVKYLLQFTLKTVEILKLEETEVSNWKHILEKLAGYAIDIHPLEGKIIKDSEYAAPDLHLRHPSLLMPIYPIGEIHQYSEESVCKVAKNTLRYVEKNAEIGVFIFGWTACAAARMGDGDMALRVLYQKGLDHMLRANGLCAEETERWNNYCTIGRSPLYYPCVMEATGEIVAAVNEMLLQSYDGIIDVFPAIPEGRVKKEQRLGLFQHNLKNETFHYGAWENSSFSKMLAKGGFEVSSALVDGKIQYIHLFSRLGKVARIRSKKLQGLKVYRKWGKKWISVNSMLQNGVLIFDTGKGEEYLLAQEENFSELEKSQRWLYQEEETVDTEEIFEHQAHTYRRIFIGKDKDTEYKKALDAMTHEYYIGNQKQNVVSVYRFDFGCGETKDYSHSLHRQIYEGGKIGLGFQQVTGSNEFKVYDGFGFVTKGIICGKDRGIEDKLCSDFLEGTEEAVFSVEVTKGKYDILIVCGDEGEESYTEFEVDERLMVQPQKFSRAGEYYFEVIPIVLKEDQYLNLKIKTRKGFKWKWNLLIINKVHGM